MLLRFSPRSQQIIDHAQTMARRYDQDYIDSEHVLLALAEVDDHRAKSALQAGGVTSEVVRKAIKQTLRAHEPEFVTGRLPGTMHFKNVIARAIEIAGVRRASGVEPEHLLLALSREQGSLALSTLEASGLTTQKIEQLLRESD